MDYKLTFEDGSAAIAHHGVKGMKWGVWNAETQEKYNGRPKYKISKEVSREIHKASFKAAGRAAAIGAAGSFAISGGNPFAAGLSAVASAASTVAYNEIANRSRLKKIGQQAIDQTLANNASRSR